ncbi:MAG: hypothetical protein Q9208_005698 [Pyrenodesmia sp. 3 TL-2023]
MFLASVLGPRALCHPVAHQILTTHNQCTKSILLPGRRYLHLVHCIYAPSGSGQVAHGKLESLAWYKLRDASEDKLQLVDNNGSGQILSLIEVQKRLQPGQFLERLDRGPNGEPTYRMSRITPTVEGTRKAKGKVSSGRSIKFTRAGRGKEMHLNSTLHVEGYRHILKTSMEHINDGCRVEMHVNVAKVERKHKDLNVVMAENPHLRPDVILRSMPRGTKMAYEPLFHPAAYVGGELIWVMNDNRKWSQERGSTGWKGSSRAPPNQSAEAILKRLPVIHSTSEHSMGVQDT